MLRSLISGHQENNQKVPSLTQSKGETSEVDFFHLTPKENPWRKLEKVSGTNSSAHQCSWSLLKPQITLVIFLLYTQSRLPSPSAPLLVLKLSGTLWGSWVQILSVSPIFCFWLHHAARGILVPKPGIEPMPPAAEAQSLNHWTAKEVSGVPHFLFVGNRLYSPSLTFPKFQRADSNSS